jgi:ABC-type dipeptide/oligopeptide/nickel transport systems, permease components
MLTVFIVNIGGWAYFARSVVLNIIREDYVTFARVKGLPQGQVVSRYIMRPAMPAILTSIFITIPFIIFGGFLLTEAVFQWWGLGYVLNIAIVGVPTPDMPVILADTYMSTLLYIVLVFILEILIYYIDPRIRESQG